jgi:hypothetical protein
VQIIHKVIIERHRPELPATVPATLQQLAAQCWAHEAESRPTFQQLRDMFSELLAGMEGLEAESRQAALQLARERGCVTDF